MAGSSNDCNPDSMPAIWLCRQPEGPEPTAPEWLTAYERATVDKFRGPRKREYLSSRWLIRQALARASGAPVTTCRPVAGRPNTSETPPGWYLSLSHSHGLSACAASKTSGLGIDIEPRQRHPQWHKVVRRWFSPVEQEWLFRRDKVNDFLLAWTLKEAWLKATGRGIANNLQTLEVREGFELFGDRPETDWTACCYDCEGFLVTLVFRAPDTGSRPGWPGIRLMKPPPEDFALTEACDLDTVPAPRIRRSIHSPPNTE